MTIFTAAQATEQVVLRQAQIDATSESVVGTKYHALFTKIELKAKKALTSVTTKLTKPEYDELEPVLTNNGYTVSEWAWPSEDHNNTIITNVTITWPSTVS